jgi:hypothetical protein
MLDAVLKIIPEEVEEKGKFYLCVKIFSKIL